MTSSLPESDSELLCSSLLCSHGDWLISVHVNLGTFQLCVKSNAHLYFYTLRMLLNCTTFLFLSEVRPKLIKFGLC